MGVRLAGAVAVVTGGANGIGRALVRRFAEHGARAVVIADVDLAGATELAAQLGGVGVAEALDAGDEAAVRRLARRVTSDYGGIDLWCSNAGLAMGEGLGMDADWEASWRLHVLAHVYAARHVLPAMLARRSGHLMITASAAGLLTEMDNAPYTATKHAAVALAEWLSIRHGGNGVGFSCLCPQAVRTAMTQSLPPNSATLAAGAIIDPDHVAGCVVAALARDEFLILPHPQVALYEQRRAADRDRWLAAMRRVRDQLATVDTVAEA